MSVEYIVKKAFVYNGKKFKPGDLWQPGGFKNDGTLISTQQFVTAVEGEAGTRRGKPLGSSLAPQENGKERLKPRYRDAIIWVMYYEEDLPYDYIAEVFNITENTVKNALKREAKRR